MARVGHWTWDVKTGAVTWSQGVYPHLPPGSRELRTADRLDPRALSLAGGAPARSGAHRQGRRRPAPGLLRAALPATGREHRDLLLHFPGDLRRAGRARRHDRGRAGHHRPQAGRGGAGAAAGPVQPDAESRVPGPPGGGRLPRPEQPAHAHPRLLRSAARRPRAGRRTRESRRGDPNGPDCGPATWCASYSPMAAARRSATSRWT